MRTGVWETQLSMDAAMERAEDWTGTALFCIATMGRGVRFTADDLRAMAGDPPGHGDAMGAVFRKTRRDGLIEHVGFTTSTRPDAHGRALRIWEVIA